MINFSKNKNWFTSTWIQIPANASFEVGTQYLPESYRFLSGFSRQNLRPFAPNTADKRYNFAKLQVSKENKK